MDHLVSRFPIFLPASFSTCVVQWRKRVNQNGMTDGPLVLRSLGPHKINLIGVGSVPCILARCGPMWARLVTAFSGLGLRLRMDPEVEEL